MQGIPSAPPLAILGWVVGPRSLGSVLASSPGGKVGQAEIDFLRMLGMPIRELRHPCVTTLELAC